MLRSITSSHANQIMDARRHRQLTAEKERTSDVARIANELQRQVPNLCRTEALKIAERAIPHSI